MNAAERNLAAGLGYLIEYIGKLLTPEFNIATSIAGWGEAVFMFWMLWVGGPARWFTKAA